MSRGCGFALLAVLADVMIAAGSASHFTGLTLLLIIGVDAAMLLLFALPNLAAARRSINSLQADALAGAPILYWRHDGRVICREQEILDVATDAQVQL